MAQWMAATTRKSFIVGMYFIAYAMYLLLRICGSET